MTMITEAAYELTAALRAVVWNGHPLPVLTDPAQVEPPALVVGPPTLSWESYCMEPTTATFTVHVVAALSEHAPAVLWALVPMVSAAIAEADAGVPTTATPGLLSSGGTDLPSYQLTVEVAL